MTFGLTPQGFNRKRLPDEKASEENALIAEFGDINVQPQSGFGQFIGAMSKIITDIWENMEAVYFSQYPNSAEGVSLDYVVALNGIVRLPAERTRVIGVCQAFESTLITQGSLARQPESNETFYAFEDTIITRTNAVLTKVSVDALAGQIYNCLINSNSYFFSLPRMNFDRLFGTGDSSVASINGVELSAVPFNTDSQTTINDLATAVQALPEVETATPVLGLEINFDLDFVTTNSILATINTVGLTPVVFLTDQATTIALLALEINNYSSVTTCTVTGARQITIVPVDASSFNMDSIVTTGGIGQPVPIDQSIDIVPADGFSVTVDFVTTTGGLAPNQATTFRKPSTLDVVVAKLVTVINAGSDPVTATDNSDQTLSILSDDTEVSFSLSVSVNMTVQEVSSAVIFLASNFGTLPAPIGSLTEILTPISGWISITNLKAGVTGREIESDAELRLRRQNSVRVLGAATVEAIRARILQQVSGVTQAFVFENRTMTEEDIEIIFASDLVTGNEITITVNGTSIPTVTFTSTHLNTMNLLKVQLEAVVGISLVTVGGAGNRTLTIEMTQGFEITVTGVQIVNGASKTTTTIEGGRFPKSFEAVVLGGTDEDVANKIWETKPAGIQTFGNTSFTITDSQGDSQVMNFSRPTPIYIWVDADLTLNAEEEFPSNGIDLVEQDFVTYGETLGIGQDVLWQKVLCQIFTVSGIASGVVEIISTLGENDSPGTYLESNITIGENEIAVFALTRTSAEVI